MRGARRDRSSEDMTYALRLANRGYDADMIFRALAAKPSGKRDPGSMKYQRVLDERGREQADAYARRTAERAITFARENPLIKDRPSALVRLLEIESAAHGLPWAVYGGPGPRRALEACFVVGERLGGPSFGLSLREWAEIAGQPHRIVEEHRNRLIRMGWVVRNPNDRPGRTSRLRLRAPPDIQLTGGENVPALRDTGQLAHDAFREEALGDAGWYVLFTISAARPISELALRTGFPIDDLHGLLRRLEAVGLVASEAGIAAPATDSDLGPLLDAAAGLLGTEGAGDADRALHQREREEFRRRGDVNVREGVPS